MMKKEFKYCTAMLPRGGHRGNDTVMISFSFTIGHDHLPHVLASNRDVETRIVPDGVQAETVTPIKHCVFFDKEGSGGGVVKFSYYVDGLTPPSVAEITSVIEVVDEEVRSAARELIKFERLLTLIHPNVLKQIDNAQRHASRIAECIEEIIGIEPSGQGETYRQFISRGMDRVRTMKAMNDLLDGMLANMADMHNRLGNLTEEVERLKNQPPKKRGKR